jgi:hypothetical protein
MVVKPFLGFLVLFFLWKRSYRAAFWAGALAAVLFFSPALILGPSVLFDFLEVAAYWSTADFLTSPFNQSVYGFLLRLFTPNPFTAPLVTAPILVDAIRWLVVGVAMLALGASVSRSRAVTPVQIGLEFGFAIVVMLIVSPLAEDIHFTHLVIPLVAVVAALKERWTLSTATIGLTAMTAAVYAYLSLPGIRSAAMGSYAFYDSRLSGADLVLTGVQAYGLLALGLVMFLAIRWYRGQPAVAAAPSLPPLATAAPSL